MRCRDLDQVISAGLPLPIREPGAARHLAECDLCRHLIEIFDDGARNPTLTERQVKRLQVGIGKNTKSVRPLPPSRFFLLACAIVFFGIVAVGAMRLGINGWAALTAFQRIAVFATLAVSARLVTATVVGQMIPVLDAPHTLDGGGDGYANI